MQTFDIYFSGELIQDTDTAAARETLGRLFKLQGKALDRLFSGTPVKIKKSADVETASRYRAAFRDAGALIDIVPHGQQFPDGKVTASPTQTPPPVTEESPGGMTLLPPRTGSLEDCAPKRDIPPLPDTSWMDLAAADLPLDETPAKPPVQLDISALSLAEANTGSLADCRVERPARQIPDTAHLQLQASDSESPGE